MSNLNTDKDKALLVDYAVTLVGRVIADLAEYAEEQGYNNFIADVVDRLTEKLDQPDYPDEANELN